MIRFLILSIAVLLAALPQAFAQVKNFVPVTDEMLRKPSPDDWLMFSRTYDAQRFSPLAQINKQTVGQLRMEWSRGMGQGIHETIPIVHNGVMYYVGPGSVVEAIDATNGDQLWQYQRKFSDEMRREIGQGARARTIAIYDDLVFFTSPDGYIVGIDAKTGQQRWETFVADPKTGITHNSGGIVVEGKFISGRACSNVRCFLTAHDAKTGKEVWRFYTTPGQGEPGEESWAGLPVEKRTASTWGLPGSYDPVKKRLFWSTANPTPYTRLKRHGSATAIPESSPADLYSNSSLALDPSTGKLLWYFQHLPGDDWDEDHTHERVLVHTKLNLDKSAVKWVNPKIKAGEERDVSVMVAEGGGVWGLDQNTGEFLWSMPFPYDSPEFLISKVDVETGKSYINMKDVFQKDGDRRVICSFNTRGYWPTAYSPKTNSLYVPYADTCLDMTAKQDSPSGFGPRFGILRPGADPNKYAGIAKIDMGTGRMQRIWEGRVPGNGAMLATAGDLIFWGDLDRRFRAFDAETGKILWESIIGGITQVSTITYAVNGKQYVAVFAGEGQSGTGGLLGVVKDLKPPRGFNAIYVFALPDKKQ